MYGRCHYKTLVTFMFAVNEVLQGALAVVPEFPRFLVPVVWDGVSGSGSEYSEY